MRRFIASLLLCGLFLSSCTQEAPIDVQEELLTVNDQECNAKYFEQGVINIKITPQFFKDIEENINEEGTVHFDSVKSMDGLTSTLNITNMRRLFPPAGEFEERTRAEGLHLWYILEFSREVSLTKAGSELNTLEGIDIVEYRPQLIHIKSEVIPEAFATNPFAVPTAEDYPFNDPGLSKQWHYYNDGSQSGHIKGSDINVMPLWKGKYKAGSEDVIVSVVDGGIDFNHEDLAGNMWHNPGKTGDTKYGKNFTNGTFGITADDHGTHVAGTVAAVNNNGKGVCGVAGGDAAKGVPGVKLMSCQIFDGNDSGSGAEAIKWGADNGAVISQNSWGYMPQANLSDTPSSDKAAIDYFNKYAGLDKNGKQVGPMAGGVVIFAAGNDNMEIGYPAEYEGAIAVASIGADFVRAYYSNYGDWCDISAPGGDAMKGPQIYSTIPGNKYGYMQGTSMACPHVSGVAALTVANKGGAGFTAEKLRNILETTVKDITKQNPNFLIGNGLVDAYMAVTSGTGTPPENIEDFKVSTVSNNIIFSLTVPDDEDDVTPNNIMICYSKNDFSKPNQATRELFPLDGYKAGETFSDTLRDLEFEQNYYVGAVAVDAAGNQSEITAVTAVTTTKNNPPVIGFAQGSEITVKATRQGILTLTINEPDGHSITPSFTPGSDAASFRLVSNKLGEITIEGPKADAGTYTGNIVVKDKYGAYDSADFQYTILPNHAPKALKDFDDQIFASKTAATVSLKITDYIVDEDGDDLSFSSVSTNNTVANVNIVGDKIHITPMTYGSCIVDITAKDDLGASVTVPLRILVRDASVPADIYPNPVTEYMYIRTGKEEPVSIKITNSVGGIMLQESGLVIDPFDPHKIDVTGWDGGAYNVEVVTSEVTLKRTIVKL